MVRLLLVFIFSYIGSLQAQYLPLAKHEFIFDELPSPQCHASSIAATNNGLVATWFGGTKEGDEDVAIYISRNFDGKWTAPQVVATGKQKNGKQFPTWNPVLFQIPNGELQLYYKVGPSPQTWWGEVITSKDGGKTWRKAKRLPQNVLGPIKNKPVLLENGMLLSPASTEVTSSSGWYLHFEYSTDFGKSWKISPKIDSATSINAIQASVLDHGKGKLQILARSLEDGIVTSWSTDYGASWSKLEKTGLQNPNSGTDAVTLKDGRHLLIYNNSPKPKEKWTGKRTPLNVAVSNDGNEWKDIVVLENEPGEYSYPTIIQSSNGDIHITYTWKRRKIKYARINLTNIK